MPVVVVHDSQFDVPVGNIFEVWELVEPLVDRIHRYADWNYTVTLAAGTRSLTVVLEPIDGVVEPEAHRTLTFYRTPRSASSALCLSCIRGVVAMEVIPIDDIMLDVDNVPEEFLRG